MSIQITVRTEEGYPELSWDPFCLICIKFIFLPEENELIGRNSVEKEEKIFRFSISLHFARI